MACTAKVFIAALSLICSVITIVSGQSINYTPFDLKVDLMAGFGPSNTPSTDAYGNKLGTESANFTVELHCFFDNNFALGFRGQSAVVGDSGSDSNSRDYYYYSGSITGDYYLTSSRVRVFAGGGIGSFNQVKASDSDISSTNFGLFPRVGIEIHHFRMSLDYNFTGGLYNYTAFNLGVAFGGKRSQ